MPFFQGATNVNASHGVFNDVTGNQVNHYDSFGSMNVNSGNTTTVTNTNSNNDSSTRNNYNYGGQQAVHEYPASWSHPPGIPGSQWHTPPPNPYPPNPYPPASPPQHSPAPQWNSAPNLAPSPPASPPEHVSGAITVLLPNPDNPELMYALAPAPAPAPPTSPPAHHVDTPAPAAQAAHEAPVPPAAAASNPPAASAGPSDKIHKSPKLKKPKKSKESKESEESSDSSDSDSLKSDVMDVSLAISGFVLTTLQFASQAAPVPFLQTAAAAALSIVKSAEQARGNKDDFERLATDACDLVYVVLNVYKAQSNERNEVPDDLEGELKLLVRTLTKVDEFGKKQRKRNGLKRFILSSRDATKIAEFREKLTQALNKFWLQSSIHVRQQLSSIAQQQGVMQKDISNATRANGVPVLNGREVLNTLSGVDFSNTLWMGPGWGQPGHTSH